MNRYLTSHEIRDVLVEDRLSDEEEIGGKEDDDEKIVINRSDHVTDSEIEIDEKISILTWMWIAKALKMMMMMTNILGKFGQLCEIPFNHTKILPADIQDFLAKYKPQRAVVIDEPSLKVCNSCQF